MYTPAARRDVRDKVYSYLIKLLSVNFLFYLLDSYEGCFWLFLDFLDAGPVFRNIRTEQDFFIVGCLFLEV